MKLYRIADFNVSMQTFGVTERQAEKWRISEEEKADISLSVASLSSVVEYSETDDLAEYRRTEKEFNSFLLEHDSFFLHASAIIFGGKCYCFCAPSGTGKSTHTRLWQKEFGENVVQILSKDNKQPLSVQAPKTWISNSVIPLIARIPM